MNARTVILVSCALELSGLCRAVAQDLPWESRTVEAPTHQYADRPATCAGCHELSVGEVFTLEDGSRHPVFVDRDVLADSVHAEKLECADCHRNKKDYPHASISAATARAYRIEQSDACNQCHYEYYDDLRDSMHFEARNRADPDAPTCVDCHGAHDVKDSKELRLVVNQECAKCHEDIAKEYETSVHGKGLTEGLEDVPTCTDCHGAHAISATKDRAFEAGSYLVCATCHGDDEKMAKYDISPNVLKTYLDDFHGVSNHLYVNVGNIPEAPMATCGDCHGVHDVKEFDEEAGPAEVRKRVADMCRECHEGVEDTFAGAWLGHSEVSLGSAPLVWLVRWVYILAIPLMVLGLLVHIGLHYWRAGIEHTEGTGGHHE
ncbi:MAG: hypothetical protein HC923_04990 [Myxococcales bacterium]|nr:hypothetical protein [Myxococcales bacterium]